MKSRAVQPRERLMVAVLVGIVAGHAVLLQAPYFDNPRDLVQFWFAARTVLRGGDPYSQIGPGLAFSQRWPLVYPLPAAVALIPLSWLSATWACAVFAGFAAACFAWTLMESGFASLLALASVCTWHAIFVVQWSPLFAASIAIPALSSLLIVKPTVGVAYFLARPTRWAVFGALALTAIAFILDPLWPQQWHSALERAVAMAKHGFPYRAPVLMPGGALILFALSRWRRVEARLLVALACVPHTTLPYELLPLFLVPRGWRQCASLAALSHVMWWLVTRDFPHPDFYFTVIEYTRTSIPLLYLPCTLMVLRRPNEGSSLPPLERWLTQYTSLVRGRVASV